MITPTIVGGGDVTPWTDAVGAPRCLTCTGDGHHLGPYPLVLMGQPNNRRFDRTAVRRIVQLVVRSASWLARQVAGALVTAEAIPPVRWDASTGRWGALVRRVWAAAPIVAAAVMAIITAASLHDLNHVVGGPLSPQMINFISGLSITPLVLVRKAPMTAFRLSLAVTILASGVAAPLPTELPFPPATIVVVPVAAFVAVQRATTDIPVGAWICTAMALVAVANVTTGTYPDVVWADSLVVTAGSVIYAATVRRRRLAEGALVAEEARSAEQRAARAVLEERTRIARELHDVVAHHMSAIAIQAEAAPLQHADDADALTKQLGEIRAVALDTMGEMRRILGVLRDETDGAALTPTPGINDRAALIATAEVAGLTVHTEVFGTPVPLPTAVGVSAYRILQEALSNAMRHAPGSNVAITITYRSNPHVLTMEIHNDAGDADGAFQAATGESHGLVGMRERATTLGGDLRAGPAADGGFLVQARLPLDPS